MQKKHNFLGGRHEETAHPRRRGNGRGEKRRLRELLRQLTPGVWLDGDWCWNMNPFVVSEENKRMVLSNITHLLRAYLNNSSYRYVLFCWVMDQPLLFEPCSARFGISLYVAQLSLVCTEQVLRERLERDVRDGIREADVIPRSLRRLLPTPHCRHANWM